MKIREVVIDGRIFLEIVDEPHPHDLDDGVEAPAEDEDQGVWIDDLVPYAD